MQESKLGHWRSRVGDFDYAAYFGFIYRVTFLLTGEMYIGKKQFYRMNKSGTKRYGESDWRAYRSSSGHLEKLMDEYPPECFYFEIVFLAKTKAILSHAESNFLHKLDALTRVDNHWGLPLYLNKQIGAVRWIAHGFDGHEVNTACRFIMIGQPIDTP